MASLTALMLSAAHCAQADDYVGIPYGGTPHAIPGIIQAEDFDTVAEGDASEVTYHWQSNNTEDTKHYRDLLFIGGSKTGDVRRNLGNTNDGNWCIYTVDVAETAEYVIYFNISGSGGLRRIGFEVDGVAVPTNLVGPCTAQTTGWDSYAEHKSPVVRLTAGTHLLKVNIYGGTNVDYYRFVKVADSSPRFALNELPGRVEFEDFDLGGTGVAYNHSNTYFPTDGSRYRDDAPGMQVTNNYTKLGWTNGGDWYVYTVDVAEDGDYQLDAAVGVPSGGTGSLNVYFDGEELSEYQFKIPETGGYDTFVENNTRKLFHLTAGTHTMKVYYSGGNADYMLFTRVGDKSNRFVMNTLPGRIEAEDYDLNTFTWVNSDASNNYRTGGHAYSGAGDSNGFHLQNTNGNDILKYTVDVERTGYYTLRFRGSTSSTGYFQLKKDGNTNGLMRQRGTITSTGWSDYQEVEQESKVYLKAGTQTLVWHKPSSVNPDYLDFEFAYEKAPATYSLPGVIEAENFDEGGEEVAYHWAQTAGSTYRYDFTCANNGNGGNVLGNTSGGDWARYTVSVPEAGDYQLKYTASAGGTGNFRLYINGVDVTGQIDVSSGGWDTYQEFVHESPIAIPAGTHVIKFACGGGMNIDKMEFVRQGDISNLLAVPTINVEAEDYTPELTLFQSTASAGNGTQNGYRDDKSVCLNGNSGRIWIGNSSNNDCYGFTFDVAETGLYKVLSFDATDAANTSGGKFHIVFDDGEQQLGSQAAPIYGQHNGWENFDTPTDAGNVVLTEGQHTMKFYVDGGLNLNNIGLYLISEKYDRTMDAGNFGTVCLPKASVMVGAKAYEITSLNGNSLSLSEVDGELTAGKPYIVEATNDDPIFLMTGDAVGEVVAANGLVGTFADGMVPQGDNYYVVSGTSLYNVDSEVALPANRAYIDLSLVSNVPAGARTITFFIDNMPTGIATVDLDSADGPAFNLNGQRMLRPASGIYIINNKKVVIK